MKAPRKGKKLNV